MSNHNHDLWEYRLTVEDEGKRYSELLAHKFHFSRKLLQRLKEGERVWVDGKFTFLNVRGKAGELLSVNLLAEEDSNIPGQDLPLQVLYEDEHILAVNKPPGQVVHPTPRYPQNTLGNAVIGYWEKRGEYRPFRPVNRIDRNTSGIVVIAKSQFAHQQLAWQSQHGKIHKCYLGFVQGNVQQTTGKLNGPIALVPGSFIQREVNPHGLPAITIFRVLRRFPHATLLEFVLKTGRTHQIRVHCQDFGHPLLGDDLYGGDTTLISRQALHSFIYSFTHPATSCPIVIRAPLPPDLVALTRKLKLD